MSYVKIQPTAILEQRGRAFRLAPGLFVPVAHVETQGNYVISVNSWIVDQKPMIARRVIQATPVPAYVEPRPFVPYVPKVKDPALTVGAYQLGDEVFVLRMSRKNRFGKRSIFAMQMVAINGERLMISDTVQKVDFKYNDRCKEVIYDLHLEHKMSIEDQESITIRYGACMICGRGLKDATSVSEGIGPVCYENMTGIKPSERKKLVAQRRVTKARELREELAAKSTDVIHETDNPAYAWMQ